MDLDYELFIGILPGLLAGYVVGTMLARKRVREEWNRARQAELPPPRP